VADARVIPIDGERPGRRRTADEKTPPPKRGTTARPSAADAVAAGASRASGERARRRRATPLLDVPDQPAEQAAREMAREATRQTARARTARPRPADPAFKAPVDVPRVDKPRVDRPRVDKPRVDKPPVDVSLPDQALTDAGAGPLDDAPPDDLPAELAAELAAPSGGADWERKVAATLAFVRRRITGEVEVDEFGFDPELTDAVALRLLRPLYDKYFRVEVRGLENVPSEGGALVVANHSGTIPLDSMMTQIALRQHHPARRYLRMLGADLVFQTPFVGEIARKTGTTLACNADAERLLGLGELVGVWPEGFKGIGKPFSERYKLQRFGRGGFVSAALRAQVPIVPCSIVGAEEIYPILGNMKTLARLLGLPYVPITPTFPWLGPLGAIPLPSKWIIEFGEPIDTVEHGPAAADDPMLVFNITDQVRETIQHALYRLLMARRSVFF
jgi:1-acyl-sn-glycerol-3-phosphate acyltransferase